MDEAGPALLGLSQETVQGLGKKRRIWFVRRQENRYVRVGHGDMVLLL